MIGEKRCTREPLIHSADKHKIRINPESRFNMLSGFFNTSIKSRTAVLLGQAEMQIVFQVIGIKQQKGEKKRQARKSTLERARRERVLRGRVVLRAANP